MQIANLKLLRATDTLIAEIAGVGIHVLVARLHHLNHLHVGAVVVAGKHITNNHLLRHIERVPLKRLRFLLRELLVCVYD